jgi:hypothetical protein
MLSLSFCGRHDRSEFSMAKVVCVGAPSADLVGELGRRLFVDCWF